MGLYSFIRYSVLGNTKKYTWNIQFYITNIKKVLSAWLQVNTKLTTVGETLLCSGGHKYIVSWTRNRSMQANSVLLNFFQFSLHFQFFFKFFKNRERNGTVVGLIWSLTVSLQLQFLLFPACVIIPIRIRRRT